MGHGFAAVFLVSTLATWVPVQTPAKPDFSGTWKLDPTASVVAPPPGASAGSKAVSQGLLEPIVVKQNAESLAVTSKPGDDPFTFTYRLDGSTSKLAWPSGAGETVDATAVAKWDADKLRIATHISINGAVYDNTEIWSMADHRLTIELTTSRGKQVRVYARVVER